MTAAKPEPHRSSATAPSAVLTPTYWGSLAALLVGMTAVAVDSVLREVPTHVQALEPELGSYVFWATLCLVCLLTIRYYIAACVNVYGGSSSSIFRWPRVPRKLIFGLLIFLVLLTISSVAMVAIVGVVAALALCMLMTFISFIIFVVSLTLQHVNRARFGSMPTIFGLGDLLLLFLFYRLHASTIAGPNDATVVGIFFVAGLLLLLLGVEIQTRYWASLREQWFILWNYLDAEEPPV